MPRQRIPYDWHRVSKASSHSSEQSPGVPLIHLKNITGNSFYVHVISSAVVRIVHQLPARFPQKFTDGEISWEIAEAGTKSEIVEPVDKRISVHGDGFQIDIDFSNSVRLEWFRLQDKNKVPLFADLHSKAYAYDESSGAVWHYTERETPLPHDEDEYNTGREKHKYRNEFVYGLGETTGPIVKNNMRFHLEGRDAVGYVMDTGDPLYKIYPFYLVFDKSTSLWYGMYYNTLADPIFDMGAENEGVFGAFRSFKSSCGPLDYYVILGDGTLPSIISSYATLLSPKRGLSSLTLPPRSQFGYLASSLGLAASENAQEDIIDFVKTCRKEGFPIDGLHLSSGWCQDPRTGARNYFVWNKERYPDPLALGKSLEKDMNVTLLANVKPWLLDVHPLHSTAESANAFVRAAPDALDDPHRASAKGHAKTLLWSSKPGMHGAGSYLDFTSRSAQDWWGERIKGTLLNNSVTGVWIDNNEFSGLMDDHEQFVGEVGPWSYEGIDPLVNKRLHWGDGVTPMGNVGRGIQTAGMAKATYSALLKVFPDRRPVIVTRSAVPGMQAYVHGTWSGDNATTWDHMKKSIALTISIGLSFGPGLYGHDIGGFEGKQNPSPELLVRWIQLGAWHTRFVVHSNKPISTTLWMYKNEGEEGEEATRILRDVVAWRYRLIPMMYSLYVTHWMRRGWPVIKPTFWYHSHDSQTLSLDEQFIFGTHVLVAPVMDKGARNVDVYIPAAASDRKIERWWELDTGTWHSVGKAGRWITIDAPLARTPVLVREGGIIILGSTCKSGVKENDESRTALLFPGHELGSKGEFTLIEDDGISSNHTLRGAYLELKIMFEIIRRDEEQVIAVDTEYIHREYDPKFKSISFVLPHGDEREIISLNGRPLHWTTGQDKRRLYEMELSVQVKVNK